MLRLNPQRRSLILEATGWGQLFDGTLNLEVAQGIVEQLLLQQPLISEPGSSVTYPHPYQDIPLKRGGYLYYPATVSRHEVTAPTLIRRAINPLPTRVEAFSDRYLRDFLQVGDDDEVACRVGT